jgi:hypothetical protein
MANFFKKIGRGLQKGVGNFVSSAGSELGKVTGGALGALGASKFLPIAEEVAPLAMFKTGGRIKGERGQPIKIIAHAGETVLPLNVKPTLSQKRVIASNKRKQKKGVKFY